MIEFVIRETNNIEESWQWTKTVSFQFFQLFFQKASEILWIVSEIHKTSLI